MSIFVSRCGLSLVFSLLVSGSVFAQWDDSDRAVLDRINVRLSGLSSIANALIDPSGNYTLHSDVHAILQFTQGISGNVQTIRDDLIRIRDVSEQLQFAVSGGKRHLLVQDVVSSNLLSSGNSELKSLNRKFDTFLDYYSNNLQKALISPWVYTNTLFFSDPFVFLGYPSGEVTAFQRLAMRRILALGGFTSPELTDAQINQMILNARLYSSSYWHYFDALQWINPDGYLSDSALREYALYTPLFNRPGDFPEDHPGFLSHAFYDQYGTHDILLTNSAIFQAVLSLTNGVPFDPSSVVESSTTPSGTSYSLSRGVVSAAVGISETFAANIDTNVVAVDTNSLVPRADNAFSGKLSEIDLDIDILSGPLEYINGSSLGDELVAVAASAPDTYTISVPAVSMLGGSTQAAELHFANIRDSNFLVIVDVICGVLKFILFLVHGRSIVDVVANNLFAPG